jgi:hypothetical protein
MTLKCYLRSAKIWLGAMKALAVAGMDEAQMLQTRGW